MILYPIGMRVIVDDEGPEDVAEITSGPHGPTYMIRYLDGGGSRAVHYARLAAAPVDSGEEEPAAGVIAEANALGDGAHGVAATFTIEGRRFRAYASRLYDSDLGGHVMGVRVEEVEPE